MNRVFVSLYLVLVLAIVVVGWGTDRLWRAYSPEPEVDAFERAFFTLVEGELSGLDQSAAQRKITALNTPAGLSIDLLALDAFAHSQLAERIRSGAYVSLYDSEGRKSSYHRLGDSAWVLRASSARADSRASRAYIVLLAGFYGVIALVIYVWVWPLSRDLRRLEMHTKTVGRQGAPQTLALGARSAVHSLATAFNSMARRIAELIAAQREMTSAVSHELRTPLARMKFALEMAESTGDAQQRQHNLDSLRADVAEMEKLIGDLLSYASYEQSDQALTQRAGDLPALVNELLQRNRNPARALTLHLHDQLAGRAVYCEWVLMERCLHNLIQNACKYARSEVRVGLAIVAHNYCVSVDDDGVGVSPEDAERVFDSFVRLRKGEGDKGGGFGLGLAIVRRIAHWHGGTVRVEASPLGGARFIVCWPRRD